MSTAAAIAQTLAMILFLSFLAIMTSVLFGVCTVWNGLALLSLWLFFGLAVVLVLCFLAAHSYMECEYEDIDQFA